MSCRINIIHLLIIHISIILPISKICNTLPWFWIIFSYTCSPSLGLSLRNTRKNLPVPLQWIFPMIVRPWQRMRQYRLDKMTPNQNLYKLRMKNTNWVWLGHWLIKQGDLRSSSRISISVWEFVRNHRY